MSDELYFYIDHLPAVGGTVGLDAQEAKHAKQVRRLQQGDRVTLFDGSGLCAAATIVRAQQRPPVLEVNVTAHERRAPYTPEIHLLCALPKGERQNVLVDGAAQWGVQSFTPLICERSIVQSTSATAERLRRIAIAACKQVRQPYVPQFRPAATLHEALARERTLQRRIIFAHPEGRPLREIKSAGTALTLVIGPEGGFTDREANEARKYGAVVAVQGEGRL